MLWLLTVAGWWYATRKPRQPSPRAVPEVPLHKQQRRLLKQARKALREEQADDFKRALLEWARLEWPEDPPRSIGTPAQRVASPLREALLGFAAARYGPHGTADWDSASLEQALRYLTVRDDVSRSETSAALPSLLPAGRA